MLQLMVQIKGS